MDGSGILRHLRARGVLEPNESCQVQVLSGGVSGATFLVQTPTRRLVTKQPLGQLAVADTWKAGRERAAVEAAILAWCGHLTPAHVPQLIDFDSEQFIIAMTAAPATWMNWRDELMTGRVRTNVGARLGAVLARWHTAGFPSDTTIDFEDCRRFLELRGAPYYRAAGIRRPDLAEAMTSCLEDLLASDIGLVHGDFSPKNVLVGRQGMWVLDFEVAHWGDPVFDLAFLIHHLVMKAVHCPDAAPDMRTCAGRFLDSYRANGGVPVDESNLVRHIGALLVARIYGKSPATYLNSRGQEQISMLGEHALLGERSELAQLFP